MTESPIPPTLGLVLAGGLARRMGGGDKARIEIGGVSILDRVLACLSAQCAGIIINANGDPERFADTGLTVVPDNVPGFVGPLAGILAGLDWLAAQNNGVEWLLSVPGDCPFLPDDLVERLHQARRQLGAGARLACARSRFGRRGMASLSPIGRLSRSTRSSTSTRPKTPSVRRALRCSIRVSNPT